MLILSFALLLLVSTLSYACMIQIKTDKQSYKIGETAIITVELKLTHSNCIKEQEEPKIKVNGLKVFAKTKFKRVSGGLWIIKYKAKVIDKNATFTSFRDCTRGGDNSTLKIKVS